MEKWNHIRQICQNGNLQDSTTWYLRDEPAGQPHFGVASGSDRTNAALSHHIGCAVFWDCGKQWALAMNWLCCARCPSVHVSVRVESESLNSQWPKFTGNSYYPYLDWTDPPVWSKPTRFQHLVLLLGGWTKSHVCSWLKWHSHRQAIPIHVSNRPIGQLTIVSLIAFVCGCTIWPSWVGLYLERHCLTPVPLKWLLVSERFPHPRVTHTCKPKIKDGVGLGVGKVSLVFVGVLLESKSIKNGSGVDDRVRTPSPRHAPPPSSPF